MSEGPRNEKPAKAEPRSAAPRNEVEISVEGVGTPEWLELARGFALSALAELGKEGWDLSILLCDDRFIRGLNLQYRDKDEPTDVLSFEQGASYRDPSGAERYLAGDIVISLDSLSRNADEGGIDRGEELRRLVLHGILHLAGMDHADNDLSNPMLSLQEELLRRLARPGRAEAGGGEGR
ncbi:MAG TPA: rRNA maturation RNase YbeY [Spirochaetales bacterium]|nr:rRNA maturation RNase YbeY [Spirochaetales bacterium]HRY56411.1 rRNA maturation RNase YbeY [Spirochaetia bacterium]HRZ65401.1 rRNA maturation RNase YbeY [Spirochaetia bacterium]